MPPCHLMLEGHPLALAQKAELTEGKYLRGEISSGKRNAQWLGEVGAGWGTPGSSERSVHGQIAQVSREGRTSEAGVVPARPRGLLGAELGSRGA